MENFRSSLCTTRVSLILRRNSWRYKPDFFVSDVPSPKNVGLLPSPLHSVLTRDGDTDGLYEVNPDKIKNSQLYFRTNGIYRVVEFFFFFEF